MLFLLIPAICTRSGRKVSKYKNGSANRGRQRIHTFSEISSRRVNAELFALGIVGVDRVGSLNADSGGSISNHLARSA